MMKAAGFGGSALKFARRLRLRSLARRAPTGPAILMYHRVADLSRDPWGLAVSPANFAAQVALLRRDRTVLPLDDFVRRLREGDLPEQAVALTFDDGYRDNLVNAAPALGAAGLPATLFLATGPMRRQRGYWWDVLERMVLDAPPMQGSVAVGPTHVALALGPPEAFDGPRSDWRAWLAPRTAREALYVRLWSLIRVLPPGDVDRVMDDLAGLLPVRSDPADGPMTEREVHALIADHPFSVASHTVNHPDLPAVSADLARTQLEAGKAEVEAITGRPASGFAYPYGRFDADVARLVGQAGFAYACTTKAGPIAGADMLALPRVAAQDRPTLEWLNGG